MHVGAARRCRSFTFGVRSFWTRGVWECITYASVRPYGGRKGCSRPVFSASGSVSALPMRSRSELRVTYLFVGQRIRWQRYVLLHSRDRCNGDFVACIYTAPSRNNPDSSHRSPLVLSHPISGDMRAEILRSEQNEADDHRLVKDASCRRLEHSGRMASK